MIRVTIKKTSMFVDKPKIQYFHIDESTPAIETVDANGAKLVVTAGQLYKLYKSGNFYTDQPTELEDQVTGDYFEKWVEMKYLSKDSSRLLEVTYAIV